MQRMNDDILVLRNVSKNFPGVRAVNKVDFNLKRGEIRSLVGKNGAGKSSLIQIITGIYRQDNGTIHLDGKEVTYTGPKTMHRLGVRAIYQTNELVPYFTVGESIMLNEEKTGLGGLVIDKKSSDDAARSILRDQLGVELDASTLVRDLDVSKAQLVQIAKNLVVLPKVLIFDEPTASLSAHEIARLFEIIKNLKSKGVSIIYISHRFDEVFDIADSITILRDGRKIGDFPIQETTQDDVIRLMVGQVPLDFTLERDSRRKNDEVLKVSGMTMSGLQDVSFALKKGEILGIFGAEGSGHEKVAQALFGLTAQKGKIEIKGEEVLIKNPGEAIRRGIGYLPRDRKHEGLVADFDVRENITLPTAADFSRMGFIDTKKEDTAAQKQIEELSIAARGTRTPVSTLSGGNQQKVVIGRWIVTAPDILILDYPTSGIDVRAKAEVYSILMRLTRRGVSIILISPEYEETAVLCDRVLVMRRGAIVKEFSRRDFDEQEMLRYAIGQGNEKSADA